MKKNWKKMIAAVLPLAMVASFSAFVACTDYGQELEDKYSYLYDEEYAENDEECDEDGCEVNSGSSKNSSSAGKSKSSSSKKNSDGDDEGSPESSSSGKNSSSSSKGTDVSSSETVIYETTCENVPYTVKTAGPNHGWGNFGYVLPLKVTSSKTQELYLAFDTSETGINGPNGWDAYSVLIALYDADSEQWIPGTEIFSKDRKNAETISNGGYGDINTYGLFEKFTFDTKGTWLEDSAGKKVNVVVNFFEPDVPSDSSGMGLDYYSVKNDTSNIAYNKLYYSMKAMECSLPVHISQYTIKDFSCMAKSEKEIYQGDTVVWEVSIIPKGMLNKTWSSMKSEAGEIVEMTYNENSGMSKVYVVYSTIGQFREYLSIAYLPGQEYWCENQNRWYHSTYSTSDKLTVLPPPVKNCSCKASASEIDVVTAPDGGVVTWTLSGCQSSSPITSYEWTGATATTNTTAAYAFGGKKGKVSPSVKVSNEDGAETTFACPTVHGYDENDPDYVFKGSGLTDAIDIPAGRHVVAFEINSPNIYNSSCTMACNANEKNFYILFDGHQYNGSYYVSIRLESSFCLKSSVAQMEFSADVSCSISN